MKQWILKKGANSFNDLIMQEASLPNPDKGQVRVKVHAVSLNYRDVAMASGGMGLQPTRDLVPLCDGAGEIDAIGGGINNWKIGDKVISQYYKEWLDGTIVPGLGVGLGSNERDGMLSEYVILDAKQIIKAPKSLSFAECATLPCAGLTAWTALNGNRPYLNPLKKGEKVLVLGTGNVAVQAITLAKAMGAEVYATTGRDAKCGILKNMGVNEVINYKKNPNWGELIFANTGGINLVVNTAGPASIDESFRALAFGGRMALVGIMDATDKLPNLYLMFYKNLSMYGVLAGSTAAFNDMNEFIDRHKLKPLIYKNFSFDQTPKAYQTAASGEGLGKVIISIV